MVSEEKLRELNERKSLLVTQCDLHRGIIAMELARARHSFDWFSRCTDSISKLRPWIPVAAPVAGYFLARHWRTVLRWSGSTFGWKLLGRLLRN